MSVDGFQVCGNYKHSVLLTPQQYGFIKRRADEKSFSLSGVIRQLIDDAMKEQGISVRHQNGGIPSKPFPSKLPDPEILRSLVKKGISQADIAKRYGVSRQRVHQRLKQ